MPRKDEILKIRISEDLKKEASAIADEEGETLAVITRMALRNYIDLHNSKKLAAKRITLDDFPLWVAEAETDSNSEKENEGDG